MAMRFQLEAFEPGHGAQEELRLSLADVEDTKLAAFEKGYSAGWEDAVAAQESEAAKLRADLGRNLQELAFSYHEARSHVLSALEPLLRDMVAKVLPTLARASLADIVLDELAPLARKLADAPVTVVVNPASRDTVEALLSARNQIPLCFVEEPSLSEGQVYLRLGEVETRVDLDGVIVAIASAVSTFFQLEHEVKQDG